LVYGAGDAGEVVVRECRKNSKVEYRPIGFIDDDPRKEGRTVAGVPIFGGADKLPEILQKEKVAGCIISSPKIIHGQRPCGTDTPDLPRTRTMDQAAALGLCRGAPGAGPRPFNHRAGRISMNLLMVTGIFPPDIGGPATYVPAMGGELVKRGHRVTVLTLTDNFAHDDRSYPFRVLRVRRGLFKPWRWALTLAAILRAGRDAELLFVNGLHLEAAVANLLLRKPLVQKIVGDWAWERATNKGWVQDGFEQFQTRRHGLKVELLKVLRSFCARRADTVIVPSQYLAGAATRWGVSEARTIVIHNAVELPPATCSTLPLSTRFNVVTVGRLVPWKQVDRLIEALSDSDETGLVIVGDGPERKRLEELARDYHVADRVYFAGQRSKEDTFGLMAACDVFVLNSTYEGFPHVVLEAMCAGLPVIASAVGGTPELIRHGENGILFAPNTRGALAKSLSRLESSSSERQRLAEGARQTVRQFQPFVMFEKTEGVLLTQAQSQG
jgi:glycosyltransferase involved in cell wall biosynthesis